jgi:uncharacterized oxidoreductase
MRTFALSESRRLAFNRGGLFPFLEAFMKLSGNTILITGGGSGIGLALAQEFHKRGNQVIVAGRSEEKLKLAAERGLKTHTVDMTSAESIALLGHSLINEFPKLNAVIHSAGMMKNENLLTGGQTDVRDDTISTNLLGPMRLDTVLLPHFLKQATAMVMHVTSGLAYAPLAMTPAYSASKAAIHSYAQSLRYQLRDTKVQVMELVPPYVATHLMGDRQASDPNAMPLAEFIAEVVQILESQPDAKEILVKRVLAQRTSGEGGIEKYYEFMNALNERMWAARKGEFPQ